MDHVEQFTHRGLTVTIAYDTDTQDTPRDWDNLGTMICWHRRYDLGDKHGYADPESFLEDLIPAELQQRMEAKRERDYHAATTEGARQQAYDTYRERLQAEVEKRNVILPLYLYDHGGITMRCSAFSCPWDSGQVGYVYVDREKVLKEYSAKALTKAVREKATACLKQEVATYDEYLTGQVYGYVVEDEEGEHVDSCWGFYGLDYCREEATGAADYAADEAESQRELEALEHD